MLSANGLLLTLLKQTGAARTVGLICIATDAAAAFMRVSLDIHSLGFLPAVPDAAAMRATRWVRAQGD